MQYTISIGGEELRSFEEAWPDNIPYRPVESIEFMYDAAGRFCCALAVTDQGAFEWRNECQPILSSPRALQQIATAERCSCLGVENKSLAIQSLWFEAAREKEKRKRAANHFPTRQIANAMAGVPDISWRRSLDRCSAQPSITYVALNLDRFYHDRYGIPVPKDRDLTGASCPVPKPLQPVLARPSDDVDKRSQLK